ncbi:MAG: nuclear transport factor 2 family protein [Pseudomonadota bacterium]
MTVEDEVRAASETFYEALNSTFNGDPNPMMDIWLHTPTVTAMRPNGGCEIGWDKLWPAWKQVAELFSGGHVEITKRTIYVSGDVAYEIGLERGTLSPGGETIKAEHRVTNIFERSNGDWKIIHHHTDKSEGAMEALRRLDDTQSAT